MTCAKKIVRCYLVKEGGHLYAGENTCDFPQQVCPRAPGEGYEKCKSVCRQQGHAEELALKAAGKNAEGCDAWLSGIGYYCRECQEKLFAAGVKSLRILHGKAPLRIINVEVKMD